MRETENPVSRPENGGKMAQDIYDKTVSHILENQDKFYRLAYSYVKDKDSALDVVQNAICKGLENCYSLKNPNAINTWFYRIVVNEALQYLRKNKREFVPGEEGMPEPVYEEPAFEKDREVYDQVRALEEPMRTVVILHYYEDLTLKQISEITDTNLNTVKTRLYSALHKLEKRLKEGMA